MLRPLRFRTPSLAGAAGTPRCTKQRDSKMQHSLGIAWNVDRRISNKGETYDACVGLHEMIVVAGPFSVSRVLSERGLLFWHVSNDICKYLYECNSLIATGVSGWLGVSRCALLRPVAQCRLHGGIVTLSGRMYAWVLKTSLMKGVVRQYVKLGTASMYGDCGLRGTTICKKGPRRDIYRVYGVLHTMTDCPSCCLFCPQGTRRLNGPVGKIHHDAMFSWPFRWVRTGSIGQRVKLGGQHCSVHDSSMASGKGMVRNGP